MYVDRTLAAGERARTARDHGVDIVLDAWSGSPRDRRAALIAAQGDLPRAASYAGGGWSKLLEGDVNAALEAARQAIGSPGMAFLEAEALFAAGAVVAGLQRLEALHARGEPEATLGLVRRRHQLGDHRGAVRIAQSLPWHAHVALAGARSALTVDQPGVALRLVEPYLQGFAPLPEPAVAAAFTVVTASILARFGEHTQLQRFVDRVVMAGDLGEDMLPAVARAAWIAGRARESWHRFEVDKSPWCVAARLELAVLAGDPALAAQLLTKAGPLGVPSTPAVNLLRGEPDAGDASPGDPLTAGAREVFVADKTVHVWRTHPHRWQPWIDAALRTPADVVVCDLVRNEVPDPEVLPWAVMDDGALVEALAPTVAAIDPARPGYGVGVGADLCVGVGVGHDWPDTETEVVRGTFPRAAGEAAVRVLSADAALAEAGAGRPIVVVAPPGDPFWAGPLPERVWPHLRVVRPSPHAGWQGGGAEVVAAVQELLQPHGAKPAAQTLDES